MSFLGSLGGIINNQFAIGENTSHSLDSVSGDGAYKGLGAFANQIDQTAERTYIEDGFIRDIRPRKRSVLFQQPDFYVVIKKRMFSTLIDNSRLDFLEEKERVLITASKRLFQNKCRLLSAYEKLTKIEQLTVDTGTFNTFLAPSLLNLVDQNSDLLGLIGITPQTQAAIEKLRKVMSYSQPGQYSNWTTNDYDAVFGKDIGEGTGTFELTNISSVKTDVSTEWGEGGATLTIEDPYNLLTVTEADIDQALTDVTNPMRTGNYFIFIQNELLKQIDALKGQLAVARQARGASQISFKTSPGTLLSQRVRAILDDEGVEIIFTYSTGINSFLSSIGNAKSVTSSIANVFSTGTVEIDPKFLSGNPSGNIGQNNQLTPSEHSTFSQIISDIFTMLAQNETSQRELKSRTLKNNYARNRMRLFFNGKYIIQPMDTISIWMTTRTGEDSNMPGGFKKQQNELGLGVAQKFDTIIKNINTSLQNLTSDENTISFDDLERLSIVGPDMPRWLWRLFRQDITNQPTGPCIFSGLVGKGNQGVSGSWSDGKWTINVSCEDHTGYFDKSVVNFKPSADIFNASIYDPLTPFDVSFDAATGASMTEIGTGDFPPLLKENQDLLQSGMLTFRSGPKKGSLADNTLYTNPPNEISFDSFNKVLHDPAGLVYRWKQGIQSLTFTKRPNKQVDIDQERSVLLTNSPFAGQDVMNVISMLITGIPYNYNTFLRAAIDNGNSLGARDGLNNLPAAASYIQGLLADIERSNLVWGNFVPHKQLVINPAVDQFVSQQRLDLVTKNTALSQKINELARAKDQLMMQHQGDLINPPTQADPITQAADMALQTKIKSLTDQIASDQQDFSSSLTDNPDVGLTVIGNEINSDPTLTDTNNPRNTPAQQQHQALLLRQKLFALTARRFWQVRANQDKNLFIVDDQYDKNFDIQAFERKLSGKIELFNSHYQSIGEQISTVRKLLGLECFANTQGHIQVRPPGYNKVPSTVFYKMFKDRDLTGAKVFPDFLESLYYNQVQGIFDQIEIIEDQIRLRAIALGAITDDDIIRLILSGGVLQGVKSDTFGFLTNSDSGVINLQQISLQANPDTQSQQNFLQSLGGFEQKISTLVKFTRLFTPSIQASVFTSFNPNINPQLQAQRINVVSNRLLTKTGQQPPNISQATNQVGKVGIITQIATFVSQRQTLLKSVLNAIKNLQEGVSLNNPDISNDSQNQGGPGNIFKSSNNSAVNAVVAPNLNRRTQIPQFLEHMIEYEDVDDLGPGSGRRYILTADRIISMTISENPPPYTMVSVNGLFGQGFLDPPSNLATSSGGNAITSAYAVDYDMWYQYGFRASKSIEAPYFSDPDSQCAPFAVATLLEARKNILQGTVSVAGYNEYYQPGDVVYIEDRNLLFYVRKVGHSFSYGNLTTMLELNYGHSPGEYVPTMLDIVGKILYGAKGFTGQYRSERFEMLGSARSLGALTFIQPRDSGLSNTRIPVGVEPIQLLLSGSYGQRNTDILSNALLAVSGSLNQVHFQRQKSVIKIVIYKTDGSYDSDMFLLAQSIRNWFLNPEILTSTGLLSANTGKTRSFGLNPDDIVIELVDFSDPNNQTRVALVSDMPSISPDGIPTKNTQGPSASAISVTRAIDTGNSKPDRFKLLLANTVLDMFIDYTVVSNTTSNSSGNSQSEQSANDAVAAAKASIANGTVKGE
jgi:hypothetical protein